MADFSTCTSRACKTETPGFVDKCAVCGSRVITSRRIRVMGGLSIACGLFLVVFMGYLTMVMYPSLANAGTSAAGRWSGTAKQARMVLNLFYTVIGFGVVATLAGTWQLVTGRRHILIVIVTLIFGAAIILQTWEATSSLEKAREAEAQPRRIVQPPPMTPANLGAPAPDKPTQ